MGDREQGDSDRNVIVLGAGFSRALSAAMPLTDELGNLCLEEPRLRSDSRVPRGGFTGGRFETWLSQIADDQPYLTNEENLENQALFLRFSSAIADKLGGRVNKALTEGWPGWFLEFLRQCHFSRSTLLTFNYDPLIECGVGTGILHDIGGREPVFWTEVIGDAPSWAPGSLRLAAERADTFRLLKLHGSLNWYWSPADPTGVSMARRVLPGVWVPPSRTTSGNAGASCPAGCRSWFRRRYRPGRCLRAPQQPRDPERSDTADVLR